jgi:hypothetical protein
MVFGRGEEKILLFGDSHMRMFVPYFQRNMDLNRYTFYVVSEFSCKLMFSPDVNNKCMRFMNTALNISKTNKFSKVIIAGFWTSYFIFDEIATQSDSFRYKISTFDLLLKELAKSSDKLYVLEGVPVGNEFDPLFMIKRSFLNASWKIQPTAFNLKRYLRTFGPMINSLRLTTEANGGRFVRTVPSICPKTRCDVLHNGQPIYFDDSHLRSYYVLEKAHFLADIMDNRR